MSTELILLSFKYEAKWNKWLGSFPIEWDDKNYRFTYKDHPWDLKFYYFSIFHMLIHQYLGSIVVEVVLRYFNPHPQFTTAYYIYFAILWMGGCAGVGLCIGFIITGKGVAYTINEGLSHLRNLRGGRIHFKPEGKKYEWGPRGWIEAGKDICITEEGSWDLLGMGMLYFMSWSLWFPVFAGLVGSLIDMNPLRWICYDLFGRKVMSGLKARLALFLYCFMLISILGAQCVRLIQVANISFVVNMQIFLKMLRLNDKMFNEAKSQKDFDRQIFQYTKTQLINMFIWPLVNMHSYVSVLFVQWVIIYLLFITVKLNKYMPPSVVIITGSAAFVLFLSVNLIIPYMNKILETSSDCIQSWKDRTNVHNKYLRRKYKTLRPLYFHAGILGHRFYMYDRSSITDFFMGIVDQMINLMITYPQKSLDAKFLKA